MPIEFIESLTSRQKQAIAIAIDCAMLPLALWGALVLRHGHWQLDWMQFWPAFVATLICVPLFMRFGLYRHIIRHMGSDAMIAIAKGIITTAFVLAAVAYMARLDDFPRSVPVIFSLLSLCYVAGTRFLVRGYARAVTRVNARKPVLIYGAGQTGADLAYRLGHDKNYRPVAIIDGDKRTHGRVIHGLTVYPAEALATLIREHLVGQVLIAVESSSDRRVIIEALEPYPVHVRLIPDLNALVSDIGPVTGIREVDIGDLLDRDEVAPLPHLLRGSVTNRVVLVTGAGGSIGSELCRQILCLEPRQLILLDQSEFALFKISRELRLLMEQHEVKKPLVNVLGSVLDRGLMEHTMRAHAVETVYHVAAYKHVNLVEDNPIQGIKNNTFGTLHAAQAALATEVANFVLISTDKAVRARSIMGDSKRLAEMVLQALQKQTPKTRFSIVRFGNVLASSGSVVPLFLEQVDNGGPVTVTHRDASRYFMTISEAAQLVLQAASMATGGDVFLLEMGKPVNILELARKIIRLKGYRVRDDTDPHGDIEIEITGLQDGEKVSEELLVDNAAFGTEHRKIMRGVEFFVPWSKLHPILTSLEQACDRVDHDAIQTHIKRLVEGTDLAEQPSDSLPPTNVLKLPIRESPGKTL